MTDSIKTKEKQVDTLVQQINDSKTLMVVSIKGLPSKQFQDIKKTIRDKAKVQVAKKNILVRTIKNLKKDSAKEIENYITENCAFLTSNLDGFELAGILIKNKTPLFAKAGQIAPIDIEVKDGPTDLVPGPAISELGALGIQIAVEGGKISIKKSKIVIKEGEIIKENLSSVLQKLHVQPFKIGLEPIIIYDVKNEKIFNNIEIDSDKVIQQLKELAGKAKGFAQKISYFTKETIGYFLAKANIEAETLHKNQLNNLGGTA